MFYTQLYQVFKKMLISEKGTLEMWNAKYVCSCGFTNYLLSIQVKTTFIPQLCI